jgi:hypothetical protein
MIKDIPMSSTTAYAVGDIVEGMPDDVARVDLPTIFHGPLDEVKPPVDAGLA